MEIFREAVYEKFQNDMQKKKKIIAFMRNLNFSQIGRYWKFDEHYFMKRAKGTYLLTKES